MDVPHVKVADGQYPLDFTRIPRISEMEACENKTGWTWTEWLDAFQDNRAVALKFAVWLALTRSDQKPDWTTLDASLDDFVFPPVDDDGEGEPAEGPTEPDPNPEPPAPPGLP